MVWTSRKWRSNGFVDAETSILLPVQRMVNYFSMSSSIFFHSLASIVFTVGVSPRINYLSLSLAAGKNHTNDYRTWVLSRRFPFICLNSPNHGIFSCYLFILESSFSLLWAASTCTLNGVLSLLRCGLFYTRILELGLLLISCPKIFECRW